LVAVLTPGSIADAAEPAKPIGVNERGVNRKAAPITANEEGIGSDSAQATRPLSGSDAVGSTPGSPVDKSDSAASTAAHRQNKIEALTIKQKVTENRQKAAHGVDSGVAADSAGAEQARAE
jgi:hypothetical protein